MPSADSRYEMGSPYGSLTWSYTCCCMPIFVFLPPCGARLDGGQDAMTHRRQGFVLPVLPHSPVIFAAVSTSETQRASRGEPRLLSAHDRQIYVVGRITDRGLRPVLRTRPGRPPPHLPALHLAVRGIPVRRPALLPPASFRRALLHHPCPWLPFASVRLGLDFARFLCHSTGHHHIAAGPCPAHNIYIKPDLATKQPSRLCNS